MKPRYTRLLKKGTHGSSHTRWASFCAICSCFLLLMIVLKVVEVCFFGTECPNRFRLLVNALVYNCIIVSWTIVGFGIIVLISGKLRDAHGDVGEPVGEERKRRFSRGRGRTGGWGWLVLAIFYAIFLVGEVGLTIYSIHNGFLLGSELFYRPLSESLMAIRGAMGIVKPILLTLLLFGGFIALAMWRAESGKRKAESGERRAGGGERRAESGKRGIGRMVLVVFVVLMCLLSALFKMSHLLTFGIDNRFVYNKCLFLIEDGIYYCKNGGGDLSDDSSSIKLEKLRLSDEELNELISTHPEWGTPINPDYPLERAFVADTFLNRYFNDIGSYSYAHDDGRRNDPSQFHTSENERPNIVIILVESMGCEYMGWGAMPFVDSLATSGLYWPNCLSASRRSYGAIPAITGSVGGPKSFQFGSMPDHNTLFSLLRNEGYNTRAYYGGEFTFDCIYEYLSAQRIDYMSPFYEAYRATPEGKNGLWWGADDGFLFRNAIKDLGSRVSLNAHLSLITTLSMHEELKLDDKKKQASYMQRVENLRQSCDAEHKKLEGVSAALFTDDCIRDFIHSYSKKPDYENTIFVITGDHASGRVNGDMLSYHHVPLIIWSPLVKHPSRFNHIVTHNDIAPALYSLLTSKYHLPSQPTVHWLGDGLGPSPKTLVIVNYMHVITDIIYHNIWYHYDTRFPPEEVYTFDTGMKLQPCQNSALRDLGSTQLQLLTKLFLYTYHANRLTAHPIYSNNFVRKESFQLNSDIVCPYPSRPPSLVDYKVYNIIKPTTIRPLDGYSSARVNIEADIKVNKDIDLTKYPDLRFCFDGATKLRETDKLSKFFDNNKDVSTETNHLSLSKDYRLGDKPCIMRIELATPMYDDDYVEGVELTLSNVTVSISYSK